MRAIAPTRLLAIMVGMKSTVYTRTNVGFAVVLELSSTVAALMFQMEHAIVKGARR